MHFSSHHALFALALGASLAFSFLLFPFLRESQNINVDVDRFGLVAQNLADGNGFVYEKGGNAVFERTPLYPFLLSLAFRLTDGFSLTVAQLLHAIVHAVTTILLFRLVVHLFDSARARFVSALYALHPLALWYTARIWVESLQAMLLIVVAFTFVALLDTATIKRAIAFGAAVGLACLTKGTMLLMPFVAAAYLSWRLGLRGVKVGAVAAITAFLCVLPWTLRNYQLSGAVVPVNTSLGFNLIEGNAVGEHWLSTTSEQSLIEFWRSAKAKSDSILVPRQLAWESAEGDRVLRSAAFALFVNDKAFVLKRQCANLCTFWYLTESAMKSTLMGVMQAGLALFAMASFLFAPREMRRRIMPVALIALYYYVATAAVLGYGRYSVPLIPLLLTVATPLLQSLTERLKA